ncbi:hypothetical protein QCA50_002551 [Cerrena zonata]|uniref:F-box domain-containing protein n=1 Tax=Cerrena zonata TaxID=2478898 RepID=A0AAW0GVR9_9APHY
MAYNTRKRAIEAIDAADTSDPEPLTSSPAKRVRRVKETVEKTKPTTTRVRRKGALKELPNMPLDIIYEILSHMRLGDLLNLSRTTKAFRELILTRGAERFWKAALENSQAEGLPPCPEWLSKPAYANLMYSPHCHNCLTGSNVQAVFFVWCVRYCKKCQDELLLKEKATNYRYNVIRATRDLCSVAKIETSKNIKRRSYTYRHVTTTLYFRKSDFEMIQKRIEQGQIDDNDWQKERRTMVWQRRKWAELCKDWHDNLLAAKAKEIQAVRDQRLASVVSKLKELGWEEELNFMALEKSHPLLKLRHMKQARALTEKAWEDIEEEAIELMNQKKVERLNSQYKAPLADRLQHLESWLGQFKDEFCPYIPQLRDVASFSVIKALVDAPPEVEVTFDTFESIKHTIVEQMAVFQHHLKEIIRKWIEDETGLQLSPGVDIFDLAVTSQIRDGGDSNPLESYFFHDRPSVYEEVELDYSAEDRYDTFVDKITQERRWSTSDFHLPWSTVKYVIEAVGEDPACVTIATMNKKDKRWYCAGTCHSDNARMIMNWTVAIAHVAKGEHAGNNPKKILALVKPEEAKQVVPMELAELKLNRSDRCYIYNVLVQTVSFEVGFPSWRPYTRSFDTLARYKKT